MDEDTKLEESSKMAMADRILREEVGDNEELRAGLITALAADIHEGGESSLFKTETFDNSRELASEASEALSSARHYEESVRDSTSAGSQISLSGDYAASLVAGSQPASRLLGNSIAAYGMVGEVDAYIASPVGQGLVETFDGDQALARTYVELGVLDGSIDTGMPSPIGEGGRAMVDDILATANGVGGQAPTGASVNAAMAGGLPLTGTVRESVERAGDLTAGGMAEIQQGIDDRLRGAVDAHGEGVAAQHVVDHQAIEAESAARHDRAEEGFAEFEQRQDRMAAEHRHPFVDEVDGATDAAKDYMSDKLREALGGLWSHDSSSDEDPKG